MQTEVQESQFYLQAAQCYILLEKYKLKTNLIGINMARDELLLCSNDFESRMNKRYRELYSRLMEGLKGLEKQFLLAEGNSLRVLNNILRDYRRKVGLLSNEPLSCFKYNKFEKDEKKLLEALVCNHPGKLGSLTTLKEDLERAMEAGSAQMASKETKNEKIKQRHQSILQVVDKTECYASKYYQNFERSSLQAISQIAIGFQKLNAYLSVWENLGSTKAYEIKSVKQKQVDKALNQSNRRGNIEETEEQLQELVRSCSATSPLRQQYKKRLAEVRRYNNEKKRRLDQIGRMSNRRRQRPGALISKGHEISIVDWYLDIEGQKVHYNYHDEFKHYTASAEGDFRPTVYEIQDVRKKEDKSKLKSECWYDRLGANGGLEMIDLPARMVQKRLQFQVARQTELQNIDDRRKREFLEKQSNIVKENERREALHIGYRHIHDKTELQWLSDRSYTLEYIPEPVSAFDESLVFSDEENTSPANHPIHDMNFITFLKDNDQQPKDKGRGERMMELEQEVIEYYFKEYAKKILRKATEPQYQTMQFFYFDGLNSIDWTPVISSKSQKLFVYSRNAIFYLTKYLSIQKEKIKCNVYSLQQIDQEELKTQLTHLYSGTVITLKVQSLYPVLKEHQVPSFMLGLLFEIVKRGCMTDNQDDADPTQSYVREGNNIINDYKSYSSPGTNCVISQTPRYLMHLSQRKRAKQQEGHQDYNESGDHSEDSQEKSSVNSREKGSRRRSNSPSRLKGEAMERMDLIEGNLGGEGDSQDNDYLSL